MLSTALNAPIEFLPVTRFPDERTDALQKLAVEKEKEREGIQSQVVFKMLSILVFVNMLTLTVLGAEMMC